MHVCRRCRQQSAVEAELNRLRVTLFPETKTAEYAFPSDVLRPREDAAADGLDADEGGCRVCRARFCDRCQDGHDAGIDGVSQDVWWEAVGRLLLWSMPGRGRQGRMPHVLV